MKRCLLIFCFGLTACDPLPVTDIHWNDGDSGVIDGMEFRLANVDAPETGPIGDRPGNARCALEQERGRDAHDFVRAFTRADNVEITRQYGTDRYGRIEIDLAVGGRDLGKAGEAAGHYQSWQHLNGRALEPRPDWCEASGK